jgi:hypothetical protein
MSQQRLHDPDASLPSPGSSRALVPPVRRYYQGTATSCRPSRRASLPSLGGATGTRGCSLPSPSRVSDVGPGICSPGILAGISSMETTGSPKFLGNPHFRLHMFLRPRPADAPLANDGTITRPPLRERRRRRRQKSFEAQSHGFRTRGLRITMTVARHRARLASSRLLKHFWTGFHPQGSDERFSTHFMCVVLLT